MSKLKVNNLSCQKGYNLLFENLSFEINSGDVLKISGPNGSGKTSLLRIIAGLSSFESGEIHYDSYKLNSEQYKLDFLYLGHLASLSPELSCIENLRYSSLLDAMTLLAPYLLARKKELPFHFFLLLAQRSGYLMSLFQRLIQRQLRSLKIKLRTIASKVEYAF